MTADNFWVGIDWADQTHQVCCLDHQGKIVWEQQVAHQQNDIKQLMQRLRELKGPVSIAIETAHGLLIEEILVAGLTVYAINPKQAHTWCQSLSVNAAKSDPADAYALGEGLRLFHPHLKPLAPEDPLTRELRLLCRDEVTLIQERTALLNRWQATLKEYYPLVLEWFSEANSPSAWDFVLEFPTPQAANQAKRGKLTGFFKKHHIGLSPLWLKRIDQIKTSSSWQADPATERAKSLLAVSLSKQLRTLEANLKSYREQIGWLFAQLPDKDIFTSLPGAGPKIGPRLAAELGQDRNRFPDDMSLLCHAGVVPLTKASGKYRVVKIRYGCNKHLRDTVYHWSFLTLEYSIWSRAFYDMVRQGGQDHATALRNLGRKWMKILRRMWQDHSIYDEKKYLLSLEKHGSHLVKFIKPVQVDEQMQDSTIAARV